jgi:hypothetical protein
MRGPGDGCGIHVRIEGAQNAPTLMLSNSIRTDLGMWDEQVASFARPLSSHSLRSPPWQVGLAKGAL